MHESGLPMVDDGTGQMRVLARLPPYPRSPFASIGRRVALKAPSEWQETEVSSWRRPHLTNQGQQSSCTGHGTETAFEAAWTQAGRRDPPAPFSPTYIYGWVNGGRDQGAVISDCATALKLHGICTEAEVPEGMIFAAQFPHRADEVAAHYKPLLVMRCQTYDDICGALAENFPVVLGILVGRNFSQLDGRGVCPLPDMVLGGHALAGLELKRHPNYGWVVGVQNSWGNWGISGTGRAYLRREHFETPTDAFAIVAVADDPGGGDLPVALATRRRSYVMAEKPPEPPKQPQAQQAQQAQQPQGQQQGAGEHPAVMAAQKCGLSLQEAQDLFTKYGPGVVQDVSDLISKGFSKEWVRQTLDNLGLAGPVVIGLLKSAPPPRQGAADPIQEGEQVGPGAGGLFSKEWVLQNLLKQLPGMLPDSWSPLAKQLASALIDALVRSLAQPAQG